MPRIRSIKPEFWTSAQVLECSTTARLMFIGMWNFCDDHGRHVNNPKQIKAEVFPADDVLLVDVLGMIRELKRVGLIECYTIDNKDYIQITGWHHQRIDKRGEPRYPPKGNISSQNDLGLLPPDRRGEERRGRERKGEEESNPIQSNSFDNETTQRGTNLLDQQTMDRFKSVMEAWAKSTGVDRAPRVFLGMVNAGHPAQDIIDNCLAHAEAWSGSDQKFWPQLDRLLTSGDWKHIPGHTETGLSNWNEPPENG